SNKRRDGVLPSKKGSPDLFGTSKANPFSVETLAPRGEDGQSSRITRGAGATTSRCPRKRPHLPHSFVAADPRNALVLKLVTLIYDDRVPPAIRRDADALIKRAADETPLSLTQRLADFYLNEVRRLFYDDNNDD